MERESSKLANRFAHDVDQAYEWGTENPLSDDEFRDEISKALDTWLRRDDIAID